MGEKYGNADRGSGYAYIMGMHYFLRFLHHLDFFFRVSFFAENIDLRNAVESYLDCSGQRTQRGGA